MKQPRFFIITALVIALSGCAEEGKYPVTGEECGPQDPVKTLDVPYCPPA